MINRHEESMLSKFEKYKKKTTVEVLKPYIENSKYVSDIYLSNKYHNRNIIISLTRDEAFNVLRAASVINNLCDGAIDKDYQGFNKADSCIIKTVFAVCGDIQTAEKKLTEYQIIDIFTRLKKYRKQLLKHGIDYEKLTPRCFKKDEEVKQ